MKSFSRYLTTANVLSWPVVLLSTACILFGNLVDSSLNGTEDVPLRIALVLSTQALFFGMLKVCDWAFIQRTPKSFRWIVLWVTIATLSMARGALYSILIWITGASDSFEIWPRLLSGLSNLALLLVLITVIYGMLTEGAQLRRQLVANRAKLAELQGESMRQAERNAVLIEHVRAELAETLAPELLDTPENTLVVLRSSIDEVIRPLTLSLNNQAKLFQYELTQQGAQVNWKLFTSQLVNTSGFKVAPGLALFVLSIVAPLVRIFSPAETLLLVLLMATQLLVTTQILIWLVASMLSRFQAWALPAILGVSAGIGAALFAPFMPPDVVGTFFFGYVGAYVFFGLVPVAVRLARQESRELSRVIAAEKSDLDWELARANEISQRHNRMIATSLHGHAQAALAAAALRLQVALRDGAEPEAAMEAARNEARKAINFEVNFDQPSSPLCETLEEIAALWRGMCEITWDVDGVTLGRIDDDAVCSRLCAELIIELCVNAIKHAGATRIHISVTAEGPRVVNMVITNDGAQYDAKSMGYGTRLLDRSCLAWSKVSRPGETSVSATLPRLV